MARPGDFLIANAIPTAQARRRSDRRGAARGGGHSSGPPRGGREQLRKAHAHLGPDPDQAVAPARRDRAVDRFPATRQSATA